MSQTQKLLVVTGATGQQGGSVANFVLSDPSLSARYKVRAITRDPTQPAAEALRAKGAEVVKGDLNDAASIKAALVGADTIFLVTMSTYDDVTRELRQGKDSADAAVAAGAKYIIFSTEVHAYAVSDGKYVTPGFDIKAEIEAYIRSLPVKSSFFAPGGFMQNLLTTMAPRPVGNDQPGVYTIAQMVPGNMPFPWIDTTSDSGKFVGAILSNPDTFAGKVLSASSVLNTLDEVAAKISAQTGKTVQYITIPEEGFRAYLPPFMQEPISNMYKFMAEYGYYGPGTEERVRETIAQVPYKLTSLDEFIAANIKL
jgi:uncharacterized protein YbjT (DUF2867 family)